MSVMNFQIEIQEMERELEKRKKDPEYAREAEKLDRVNEKYGREIEAVGHTGGNYSTLGALAGAIPLTASVLVAEYSQIPDIYTGIGFAVGFAGMVAGLVVGPIMGKKIYQKKKSELEKKISEESGVEIKIR